MKLLSSRLLFACSMIAGGSILSAPSRAALITVDPGAYSNGTNISTSFTGVTLSTLFNSSTGSVYSVGGMFGSSSSSSQWGGSYNDGMKAAFAVATDYVQIDFLGNSNGNSDRGQLTAYDASNNVLATFTTNNLGNGVSQTLSISLGTANIAYVIATGYNNKSISLDNLQYNGGVPEPSSVVMLGCGAAALLGVLRRRRTTRV